MRAATPPRAALHVEIQPRAYKQKRPVTWKCTFPFTLLTKSMTKGLNNALIQGLRLLAIALLLISTFPPSNILSEGNRVLNSCSFSFIHMGVHMLQLSEKGSWPPRTADRVSAGLQHRSQTASKPPPHLSVSPSRHPSIPPATPG